MSQQKVCNRLTRRQFLKAVGGTAGIVAATPLLSACRPLLSQSRDTGPLKIGVLNPYSDIFAVLGESVTEGMRMYFDEVGNEAGGRPIELVIEDTQMAPDVGLQKARKLVQQDEVDLVAGIVSSGVANAVRDFFHENQKLLIVATAFSNSLTRDMRTPYIFRTSTSGWQNVWPLAGWAYDNIGKTVFISASDYAAGHDAAEPFLHNFEANGGQLSAPIQYTPFPSLGDPAPFITEIAAAEPDMVFIFYAGGGAVTFIQAYHEFGLTGEIPLVASGFAVEDHVVLPAEGEAALGAISGLHWVTSLDNPENVAFTEAYQERTGNPADVYALQGYDTARVIVDAVNALQGDTSNVDSLIQAVEGVEFTSPRGEFKFDLETHNVINHCYVREVVQSGDQFQNILVEDLGIFPDPGDNSKG